MSTAAQAAVVVNGAAAKRYRPRYQAPEELLVHSSAAKRYSRSNSAVTTPQRSPTASQEPAPLPVSHAPPLQHSATAGPITTPEWIRSFYEHGVVVDVTPKRRVAAQLVTPVTSLATGGLQHSVAQTPRSGGAGGCAISSTPQRATSAAVSTPSVFTQRRIQSASPNANSDVIVADSYARAKETTLMFGVDFEEVARRRQALYLSEEGDRFKNAGQRSSKSPSQRPDFKSASLSALKKPAASSSRQSFMEVLSRKKDKEREHATVESLSTAPKETPPMVEQNKTIPAVASSRIAPPASCRPALPSRPSITTPRAASIDQLSSSSHRQTSCPPPSSASSMMQQYLAALATKIVVAPVPADSLVSVASPSASARAPKPKETKHIDPSITSSADGDHEEELSLSRPLPAVSVVAQSKPQPLPTPPQPNAAITVHASVLPELNTSCSNDTESSSELTTAGEASEDSKHDDSEGLIVANSDAKQDVNAVNEPSSAADAVAESTSNHSDDIEFVVEEDTVPEVEAHVVSALADVSVTTGLRPVSPVTAPTDEDGELSRDTLEIREYVTNFRALHGNVLDEDCPFPDIVRHDLQVDATLHLVGKLLRHDWLNPHLNESSSMHNYHDAAALRASLLLLEGGGPSASFEELDASQRAFTQDICEGVLFALLEYEVADVVAALMNDIAD
jgi:hypothetical protein